jgi:tetratricopeptide (TPR) repeat protein
VSIEHREFPAVDRPACFDELDQLSRHSEFDEIVSRCQSILQGLQTRWENAYPETAKVVECLAHAYYGDCDYCAAALEFERALAIHRAHCNLPSDHQVRCLMYLGRMLLWTGRPAEAEEMLSEAMVLLDHLPVEKQGGRAFVLTDLGHLHEWEGELQIAEQVLVHAMQLMMQFGYRNRHFCFVYFDLARVFESQGRETAADRAMEKSICWLRGAIDEDHHGFATFLSVNGLRLQKRGRLAEARACHSEALAILQRIRKPGHRLLERVKDRLAKLDAPT